jgi:glycerol-3-phosphate O-acyltransferase/dihydroxyacetone phosphate acyltransferase
MYAPLGTQMSLGDYVRLVRTFLEAFKASADSGDLRQHQQEDEKSDVRMILNVECLQLRRDLKVMQFSHKIHQLTRTGKTYQDRLSRWGIKDDRIRRPLPQRAVVSRICIRLFWSLFLVVLSLPGLVLWLPVFATTYYTVHNFKKTGPIFDTWDEIAQYKLIYGLLSGLAVWFSAVLLTLPFALVTIFLVPALMWITLRWLEDAVSAFRAFTALVRLLCIGQFSLRNMAEQRKDLHSRVMKLATQTLNLPEDPESYFIKAGGREKGRVKGTWDSGVRYFSVRRRRKRDWNETLRLYDKVDYPDD